MRRLVYLYFLCIKYKLPHQFIDRTKKEVHYFLTTPCETNNTLTP